MTTIVAWCHSTDIAQVRTESANRVAVLHLDATQPVVLEGPAATIWDLIDGERTEQSIVTELQTSFEDEAGQMRAQVEAFLAGLADQQLIEPASAASN